MGSLKSIPLRPLDRVEVRPWAEIAETLDEDGKLDGLPFMPEMVEFCGRRFTVSKRLERSCDETEEQMRRIRDIVFLENLRCNGAAHGDCQKGCLIFWKEAWLRKVDALAGTEPVSSAPPQEQASLPCTQTGDRFVCQSTELVSASTPIRPVDLLAYYRDVRSHTYSIPELAKRVPAVLLFRAKCWATGKSHRVLEGCRTKTPSVALHLQPGEWVKVKTKDEISATLDKHGKNRGLAFTHEMVGYCGGTFQVLRRLERMIHEPSQKIIYPKNTVILAGATCQGCYSLRGGCPRANYHFWREIWLERTTVND